MAISVQEYKALRSGKKSRAQGTPGETANQITANVIRAINMQPGCVAYRINNVGIYDEKIGKRRKSNTQKGIFDIASTMFSKSVWLEVKAGKDTPSNDQLIFQQEQRIAGGIAEFIHSTDEGLRFVTEMIEKYKHAKSLS